MQNTSDVDVYVGSGAGVVAGNGFLVKPGGTFTSETAGALYAIAPGTVSKIVRVSEDVN